MEAPLRPTPPGNSDSFDTLRLDSVYGSEFLEPMHVGSSSPPPTYPTDRPSPDLNNLYTQSLLSFAQSPTLDNTALFNQFDSLEASGDRFQQGASPKSSVGSDYLGGELDDPFGHRSRIYSHALSSITQYSTSNSSPSVTSNGPSPYVNSTSSPMLLVPGDSKTGGSDPNAWLFPDSQPGLTPPSGLSLGSPPSLGLIPATPVSPRNRPKLAFQDLLRQQVAQRRAEYPIANPDLASLLSVSQSSDNGGGSRTQSPSESQQATWSTVIPQQPPMAPTPPVPLLSDSNLFLQIRDPRPTIGAIPSASSNLGVYATRSDPLPGRWSAALPPAIRPIFNPTNIFGNRAPDLNLDVGGSLWDHPVDTTLGPIDGVSMQHAQFVGDNNNRREHNHNARNEDVSSAFRGPEQSCQLYTVPDGSPAASVVISVPPSEFGGGGVGPTRHQGHERSSSGSHRQSPHANPRMLPDDNTSYGGISLTEPVERVHATTPTTREAISHRRTTQANFKCPVPGCGSTFMRHFNLRAHIRSHNEEKPFKCKWPGCDKLFARQHDCKRHEALHLNIRPLTCKGCQKTFARMDALNRHLRSEDGAECRRVQNGIIELGQEVLATLHDPERHENVRPEREPELSFMRGTKRNLEEMEVEDIDEQGGEPKRGKIIRRDYADVVPNHVESAPHIEHSNDKATQDTETGSPVSDTRCTVTIQSGQITCEEMFQYLVDHGCTDLSSDLDPGGYSSGLIQGGAFGDIWKGKLHDGTEVAIKVWRFTSLLHNGSKCMKRAMREIYYWSKAKHEYVQELMGVIMFQGRLGMVSLWMDNGNLREYICKNPNVDRYPLCLQVATGIAYLHSREMVHGDLKGTNILVSHRGVAKLSDFDHSIMSECSIAFSETSKLGGGTTRWMAPELILDDDCSRSACTDVYALGMTMLEIITGSSPYSPQCKDDVNVIKAIMKKQLPSRPMDRLSDNLRDNRMWELLLRCWDYDPLGRPIATEVVESLEDIIALPAISGLA